MVSVVAHISGCAPTLLYVLLYKADDVPGPRQNLYSISPQVAGTLPRRHRGSSIGIGAGYASLPHGWGNAPRRSR